MRTRTAEPVRLRTSCAVALTLAAVVATNPGFALAADPPSGQWYYTLSLGLAGPYQPEAMCLQFKSTRLCTQDGICGTWARAGSDTFSFQISYLDDTVPVVIEGVGRVENEGDKDSMAATAQLTAGDEVFNFGLAGRPTGRKRKACTRKLRDWHILTTPPQPPQDGACVLRAIEAGFGSPAKSEYILPFAPGNTYFLSQTYCNLVSSHRNELSYDFDMPVDAEILAARAGEVVEVVEGFPNDQAWPDNNRLQIRHADGTVARYLHVAQNSVVPAVGAQVARGETIARAAMSGTIEPHLHFAVYQDFPGVEGGDVPVSFRNCDGPIDSIGGLIQNQWYTAEER